MIPEQLSRIEYKIGLALRNAREARRHSWQEQEHRAQYRRLSREAMSDARDWRRIRDTLFPKV